jgi:hypothetical protein
MLRWIAIVLFIAGIVVALYGRATAQRRWVVTGVAATIAGALTLAVLPDERGVWPKVKDEVAAARTGQYDFTADWFDLHIENWTRDLAHIAGRPSVRFLEIGSHEGRAAVWLLRNVLTHDTARIDCVDVFDEPAYTTRFDHNVKVACADGKINKIVGRSQEVLRQLRIEHYDAIYVHGSHTA